MKQSSLLGIDWSSDSEIAGAISEMWETRSTYKYYFEREWFRNISWYIGHQNLIWSDVQKSMVEPNAPHWRVRLVINRIQPVIRILAAKLFRGAPEWDVIPATTDSADLQIAQVANQVLQANWYNMEMPEKMYEAIHWMLTTGNAFIRQNWNPDIGDPILSPDSFEEFEFDEDLFSGDVEAHVVPPFDLDFDPDATNIRDAAWALESYIVNKDKLEEIYPEARDLGPENLTSYAKQFSFSEQIKNLAPKTTSTFSSSRRLTENVVIVHNLWIPARPKNKKGLDQGKYIVVAGNKVLHNVPYPYLHNELPYAHFKEIEVPGRFWGTSTVSQLISPQSELNKTRSQLAESRNMMTRPKWLVPHGAKIDKNAFTSEPGEVVFHTPGLVPQQAQMSPIPSYVTNSMLMAQQDIEDISGVHEVQQSEAPGQIRSGRGVLALVEQDEKRLDLIISNFDRQLERLGRQNLSIVSQYVREDRMAKIVGTNDELLLFEYTGGSLIGSNSSILGVSYFDVHVKTESGLPHSRAAQLDLLGTLLQNRVLQPEQNPSDRRLVLKLLSVGSVQNHLDKARVHRSRQLNEIHQLMNGNDIQAEYWHNHEVHIDVINEFRNSASYDRLDPAAKQALEAHAQAHYEYQAREAVRPELMTRKAAMVGALEQGLNETAQAAAGPAGNVLGE